MAQNVRVIPATLNRATQAPIASMSKRKVAGYARVSTDQEEQQTSYEAQVDYYTNFIKGREDWEFVSVYTEEERSYPVLFRDISCPQQLCELLRATCITGNYPFLHRLLLQRMSLRIQTYHMSSDFLILLQTMTFH